MNRSTKILSLLLVLLGIGYYVISKKPWRTASKAADAFAVKDTASVNKIFMANKMGQRVLLERTANNTWLVNGKIPADEFKIKLLLGTLHDLQIQMPVPPTMHNTIIAQLASKGVKTEIYANNELIKTIYVGSETADKTGTFMLMEGEDQSYVIQIPGFVGFLTPRFFITEIKWRSKLVFDIPADQIQSISINYPEKPNESFTYNKADFEAKGILLNNNKPIAADTQQVKLFLHSFEQKYAEGFYDDSTFLQKERDSLLQLTPYCKIELVRTNGSKQNLQLFYKPVGERTKFRYDDKGNELSIDPEKFYAKIDEIPQIGSIQEYTFRKILASLHTLKK